MTAAPQLAHTLASVSLPFGFPLRYTVLDASPDYKLLDVLWYRECAPDRRDSVVVDVGEGPQHWIALRSEVAATRQGNGRYDIEDLDRGEDLTAEVRDELANDLVSRRKPYQGSLTGAKTAVSAAFERATATVAQLEADREPAGFRPGAAEALGLGVCACGDDLASECKRCNATRAVSL